MNLAPDIQQQASVVEIPASCLNGALLGIGKCLAKSASIAPLECIRIERHQGGMSMIGSDLDHFVEYRVPNVAGGDHIIGLIPHKVLKETAKSVASSSCIRLVFGREEGGGEIRFAVGGSEISVPFVSPPASEYPPVPKLESGSPLDESVKVALLEAMHCASRDEQRYVLQGAYLDVGGPGGHRIVATDGSHLYCANSFSLPVESPVIVPLHRFLSWKGFASDGPWSLSCPAAANSEDTWFSLSTENWSFTGKTIDGNFPNYRQVTPRDEGFTSVAVLQESGAKALSETLASLPATAEGGSAVRLRIESTKLLVANGKSDTDSPWIQIPWASCEGKSITIVVDRRFPIKALGFGMNRIRFMGPQSPMLFDAEGKQMLAMPMLTPGEQPNHHNGGENPDTSATNCTTHHKPMIRPNDTGGGQPTRPAASETTQLEAALATAEALKASIKTSYQEASDLCALLKRSIREHRAEARELQSVRQTIKSLQSVKL